MGLNPQNGTVTVSSANAKRGIYITSLPPNWNSGSMAFALQGYQTCRSLPGSTVADGNSWWNGFSSTSASKTRPRCCSKSV